MGMYDTVHLHCPKCNATISEQTKAGDCTLKDYSAPHVPTEIAEDLDGTRVFCKSCHTNWIITKVIPEPKFQLFLRPAD